MRRPCWRPFQEHQHAWRPKQESLWQITISTPVDLVLLQITLKVIYEYFSLH